jgi:hypothetical protein
MDDEIDPDEVERLAVLGQFISGSTVLRLVDEDMPGLVHAIRLLSRAALAKDRLSALPAHE